MNKIYCFWTGDNEMSENRKRCLAQLKEMSKCNVVLITKKELPDYILPDHPLHEAYQYLSETHKADYLRTYFMNFYGEGYCDIKMTCGSWVESFAALQNSDKWICGYAEIDEGGVAYKPYADKWRELLGNGSYICKPQTPFTNEWYAAMLELLDSKLEKLKEHPATYPQDSAESGRGYPIEWNEMLGRIFHRVLYKYKDYSINTLPMLVLYGYR